MRENNLIFVEAIPTHPRLAFGTQVRPVSIIQLGSNSILVTTWRFGVSRLIPKPVNQTSSQQGLPTTKPRNSYRLFPNLPPSYFKISYSYRIF